MPDIQSLPYLILPLVRPVLLSSKRCGFPLRDKNTVQVCRCFPLFMWTVWVSPHSLHDGIYFASACALTHCNGHISCCWSACRCSLGDRDLWWPAKRGTAVTALCWARSSLDWLWMDGAGQGWNKQRSKTESVCMTELKSQSVRCGWEWRYGGQSLLLWSSPVCMWVHWNIFFINTLFLSSALLL